MNITCIIRRTRCARRGGALLVLLGAALAPGCGHGSSAPSAAASAGGSGGSGGSTPSVLWPQSYPTITATVGSTRFVTREHFFAAGEMQISGEPLAETMGRDLTAYSRDHLPTDIYFDKSPNAEGPWIDLPGFSTGVESYEYSKQAMNGVAFESGAGTSLLFGPLTNPTHATGAAATTLVADKIQHFASGSNALGRFVFPAGTFPSNNASGTTNPNGVGTPAENPLGWPGIWPTAHVFRSFDPSVQPTGAVDLACAISSDDDPGGSGALGCADYECVATTLHLPNRSSQIETVITPGSDGFSAWKYGLWVINYLQVMHDSTEAAVTSVDAAELANVGTPGNLIVGADDQGAPTAAGTFLGSSDIEGFQAQLFIQELDDRAEDWLMHLSTSDGATLSGFSSLADALAYDESAPLRWFPRVSVTEADDPSGFPSPTYALASPDSDLFDQLGLAMGYAELFALTDTANADVGGAQPAIAYFDGDPFASDDQMADGEPTVHDRALGILRVTLVNLDRLHRDPASGLLVDSVAMTGGSPARGTTVSTVSVGISIVALRTALRSLTSELELYSNNTSDTAGLTTPLDSLPLNLPDGDPTTFGDRFSSLLRNQAELLLTQLTDDTGKVVSGWDVSKGAPLDDQDLLDAHTAAVRGLFAAYFATGDVRYHDRALLVLRRLDSVFFDEVAGLYDPTPAPLDAVEYTPMRFALLQSALREEYENVAARPGGEAMEQALEARIARLDKLVLNGWNDQNLNRQVDWPGECVNVVAGLPRGGLQMAERTLTGETGSLEEHLAPGTMRTQTSDRENDCVPEIDDAKLPSALADSITFQVMR